MRTLQPKNIEQENMYICLYGTTSYKKKKKGKDFHTVQQVSNSGCCSQTGATRAALGSISIVPHH